MFLMALENLKTATFEEKVAPIRLKPKAMSKQNEFILILFGQHLV